MKATNIKAIELTEDVINMMAKGNFDKNTFNKIYAQQHKK